MQKIAPIILLREKDTPLLGKRYFRHCRSKTSTLSKCLLICSIAAGLCCSVKEELGIIGNMGQRQDKDEIVYGDDCLAVFPEGETPMYVYARFSKIVTCPGALFTAPNDRTFKLTQVEDHPCWWSYIQPEAWVVTFRYLPSPSRTQLILSAPPNFLFFAKVEPTYIDEGVVLHNDQKACAGWVHGIEGIGIVTWQLETIRLLKLLNMKSLSDIFMEMRPLVDGYRVYKFCRLHDATNVKILYLPGKVHRVTGTLTPDATGDYSPHKIHNGKISYRRTDGLYFLWWDGATTWVINTGLDILYPPAWLRVDPDPVGDYQPIDPWTGITTVAVI